MTFTAHGIQGEIISSQVIGYSPYPLLLLSTSYYLHSTLTLTLTLLNQERKNHSNHLHPIHRNQQVTLVHASLQVFMLRGLGTLRTRLLRGKIKKTKVLRKEESREHKLDLHMEAGKRIGAVRYCLM